MLVYTLKALYKLIEMSYFMTKQDKISESPTLTAKTLF